MLQNTHWNTLRVEVGLVTVAADTLVARRQVDTLLTPLVTAVVTVVTLVLGRAAHIVP